MKLLLTLMIISSNSLNSISFRRSNRSHNHQHRCIKLKSMHQTKLLSKVFELQWLLMLQIYQLEQIKKHCIFIDSNISSEQEIIYQVMLISQISKKIQKLDCKITTITFTFLIAQTRLLKQSTHVFPVPFLSSGIIRIH